MPRNDEINASINVWFVDAAIDIEPLEQLLIPDERTRARRYRFEADRRRSIVARAALRRLVGNALGAAPREVPIVIGENDKPRLDNGALHFNATHSGDLVAIAIAATEVGVDAEQLRPMSDAIAIAERFFSPAEVERLKKVQGAPAESRRHVEPDENDVAPALSRRDFVLEEEFFTIWTMKEAVVKGIGSGIMASLQSFTTPEHATALAAVECGNATFSGWHTMSLGAPEGYRAAVATKSASAQVIVRPFRF